MSTDASLEVLDEQHPLALELASLQRAVTHYQLEVHKATLQLQHQSLESRSASQRAHTFENEVNSLKTELIIHRSHAISDDNPQRAALQIQELTLALRRLSDKLDLTEQKLVDCKEEIAKLSSERDAATYAEVSAHDSVTEIRLELEASNAENRELLNRVKMAEEQTKMSDLVVEEYASLVRSMEGRSSKASAGSLAPDGHANTDSSDLDGLGKARAGLQMLLQESNAVTEKLQSNISELHGTLEALQVKFTAQAKAATESTRALAQAQAELIQLKNDDNAAAKMVSRYMKFSQSSTDLLHRTIENLKKRHASTVETYDYRIQYLEESIVSEKRQNERLFRVLDELSEDISREVYGRRREVSLRLAILAKEEMISEKIRRWILRAQEKLIGEGTLEDDRWVTFRNVISSAHDILRTINAGPNDALSSAARLLSAEAAAASLRKELQLETDRRLFLEQQLTSLQGPIAEREELVKKGTNGKIRLLHMTLIPNFVQLRDSISPRALTDVTVQTVPIALQDSVTSISLEPYSTESRSEATQTCTEDVSSQDFYLDERDADEPCLPNVLVTEPSLTDIVDTVVALSQGNTPTATVENGIMSGLGDLNRAAGVISLQAYESQPAADPNLEPPVNGALEATEMTHQQTLYTAAEVPDPKHSLLLSGHFPQEDRFKAEQITDTLQLPHSESESTGAHHLSSYLKPGLALLLPKLSAAEHRYDEIQRQFNDCSMTLQEMKRLLLDSPEKPSFLPAVMERLYDYCEDSRVELEIRISDEERIIKGYQTLLSVPGALSDEIDEAETRRDIEAFVDGSDPAVHRAQDMMQRKLEDLQHDIASVKHALHESQTSPSEEDSKQGADGVSIPEPSSWTSWTGSFLSSSRSPSPAPSFGAVMTSPRLRHSSSSQRLQVRRDSYTNSHSPFNALGLRIPMPSSISTRPSRPSISHTPSRPGDMTRPRVISNAFNLGIRGGLPQARASSFSLNRNNRPSMQSNTPASSIDFSNEVE